MRFGKATAFLTACVLALPLLSAPSALASDKVEVRFSAYYPEHYPVFHSGWQPWEVLAEKESNGVFTFKNYLNGVLHAASHGFRATKSGVCDITTGYPSYQPGSFSLSLVNDLPFLFPNTYMGPLIMEELYPKYFKGEYEKMGVYLGAWVNVAEYNLISKKPVRTLEDLKGMKIRSIGGICSEYLEALGAVPVMLQFAESYTGLQTGVVDAVLVANGSMEAMKLYEVAKHLTNLEIMHMGIPYAMNRKFFDSLTPDQKTFFYNKLRQASQIASQAYDLETARATEVMVKNGVEIIDLSAEEKARLRAAVQPVIHAFVERNEAKGLPARQMMDDIYALRDKYQALTPQQALELVARHPFQGIIDF